MGIVDSETVNLKEFYLQEGPQTQITDIVRSNADLINSGSNTRETVENIMDWLHRNLICSQDSETYQEYGRTRNTRSATEVIQSHCATGCKDFTVSFAALARAKGISATVTETVREQWIFNMVQENTFIDNREGHFFSEVYLPENGVWVVVDPTANRFSPKDSKGYYSSGPGNNKRFMLFERGLDAADYGIVTQAEFDDAVKKRFYIEGNYP